jgi:RNA polymerase sigma-B factor
MNGVDRGRTASWRDRTTDLLQSYRAGDLTARERLIELHLPLVRVLARRYADRGERLEDLVQVGSIGLIEAIDRFDPERGRDLVSFAVPTITGEIKNHLRDRTNVVRIPRRVGQLNVRVRAETESLASRLRRPPTLAELARETGVGESDVVEAIETERARSPVPLPTGNGNGSGTDAAILVDGVYDPSEDRLLLAAGFRALDARQRRILHLRYFAELSQAEIAAEVGLSQMQVSRVIRTSLERLRGALGRDQPLAPAVPPLVRL